MRIFGNLLHAFRITRRVSCSSISQRRYSSLICCNYLHSPRLTNPRLHQLYTTSRASGSGQSGNSKCFNPKIGRSSRRYYNKSNKSSDSQATSSPYTSNKISNILPVALINHSHNASSFKIMLIPINLFEGENDELQKTLAMLSIIRDNARQIEAFTENLPIAEYPSEFPKHTVSKKSSNKIRNKNVTSDTPILNEFEGNDDYTFWQNTDHLYEPEKSETFDVDHAFTKKNVQSTDAFDANKWNESKKDIYAVVPQNLDKKLQDLSIASMELAFEMDMTNVKDALQMAFLASANKLDGLHFQPHHMKSLKQPTLALTTSLATIPKRDSKTVPLNFNALIQGTVEIDASKISSDQLSAIKVPEFNDYVTAIAANICSTALQKGFPSDISRMSFSTKSGVESSSSKSKNPHIVCVREGEKGCISPGLADNPKFEPSGSSSGGSKSESSTTKSSSCAGDSKSKTASKSGKCSESSDKPVLTTLSISAIIGEYNSMGLMNCKAYARAIEEAQKRRTALCGGPKKESDCKKSTCASSKDKSDKCGDSKDPCKKASKTSGKSPCKSKDPCKKEKKDPCKKEKKDPCKKEKKDPCKKEKKDPCKKEKKDPCKKEKKDPCKKEKKDPCKKEKKDPCKKEKKDPCKKEKKDPCQKEKKDPCKKEKKDPCQKEKKDPCKKEKKDPCKKEKKDPCKKEKKDPCKSEKKDPCKAAKKSPCQPAKKASSSCGSNKDTKPSCNARPKRDTSKCGSEKKNVCKDSKEPKMSKCENKKSSCPPKKPSCGPAKPKDACGSKKPTCPPKKSDCGSAKPKCQPPKAACGSKKQDKCGKDSKKEETKCPNSESKSKRSTKPNCPNKGGGKSGPCKSKSFSTLATVPRDNFVPNRRFSTSDIYSVAKKRSNWSDIKYKKPTKCTAIENIEVCDKSDPCKSSSFGSLANTLKYSTEIFGQLKWNFSAFSTNIFRFFSSKGDKSKKLTNPANQSRCDKISATKRKLPKRKDIKYERKTCFEEDECPTIRCKKPPCGKDFKSKDKCPRGKSCDRKDSNRCKPDKENKNFPQSKFRTSTSQTKNTPDITMSYRTISTDATKQLRSKHTNDDECIDETEIANEVIKITDACQIERVPESVPRFSEYDVLIRTNSIAISGSDLHVYECGNDACPGITIGHDASGVVEKVGKCVQNLRRGDRVAIESGLSCGICDFCKRGAYNICSQMIYNGFFVKYQVHPADLCHKLPTTVSLEEGCMTQILSLGCQACYKARIKPTSNVVIIGSCPTAISAGLCARAIGANRICFVCRQEQNLQMIRNQFDFDYVHNDQCMDVTDIVESIYCCLSDWPDVVINCAVTELSMNIAVMSLAPCGTCVLAECESECASFNAMDVIMKNLHIVPSFRSTNMFPIALQLMECGQAPMGEIIAKAYKWNRIESAFQAALNESNVGNKKVIVKCADEDNSKGRR